ILHHSLAARIVHIISLIVFIGFLCEPTLKAIYHAIVAAIANALSLPGSILRELFQNHENYGKLRKRWRWAKLIIIPILAFWIFYAIFYASNPVFSEYSDSFWNSIGEVLADIFKDISILWILQLIFGIALVGLILFRSTRSGVTDYEKGLNDDIKRQKKHRTLLLSFRKITLVSLKNEYKSALVLVGSINALLLLVNAIDIYWIWFNFEYDGTANLSQLVHEGTYLLILSILLSMGILLYFFRRNLNFLPNNVWLRRLANVWIIQNTVLVISVIIRNYHYMYHFGLAYKRIGVVFFLTAVIIGLITLFFKINKAKTTFYLLRVNSWGVYCLLLILSSVNWDIVIVKHNIQYTHEKNLDAKFLLYLSEKTLPIIDQNREKFNSGHGSYAPQIFERILDRKIQHFIEDAEKRSWKSWNYADAKALDYFTSSNKQ
ncbi:DUF4173 domain-containing protein, partial [Crocinitomicaceae bacterium]|nr:DUF4173 domain-containing protein [Crocinitomicaceae bacterium]